MKKNKIYKNDNSTDSNLQTRQNQLLFDVFQNPLWKDWYPDINQVQHAIVLTASPRTEKKWNTEYKTASPLSVVTPKLKKPQSPSTVRTILQGANDKSKYKPANCPKRGKILWT